MHRLLLALGCAAAACGDDGGSSGPDATPVDAADAAAGCDRTAPWATAAPLPLGPTQETAVVALDGRIYVIGGFNGELGVLRAVQVFDTATCTWSLGPELPMAIHHANAAVVGDTIYVLGGMTGLDFQAIGDGWSWNPSSDAIPWTPIAPMPAGTQRGSAAVAVVDADIYLAGGLRGGAVAQVSAYETDSGTWNTALPPLPAARDHGCGAAAGGSIYVVGGRSGTIGSTAGTVYTLSREATPIWLSRALMPTPRGGTACGTIDGRIIVVGGEGNPDAPSGVYPQVESYFAATDQWSTLAPMVTPRHGMGAAAWDGRLYVPGGAVQEGFGADATVEILTP